MITKIEINMQPYQQTYRVFTFIWGFLIFWNLFIAVGALLGGAVSHTPQVIEYALLIWFTVSIVGTILLFLTVKGAPIIKEFKTKLFVIIIMVCASFFPTLPSLFHAQISDYIVSWEAAHCIQSGEHTVGGQSYSIPEYIYTCDNGDKVYKSSDTNVTKRFWDGGIQSAHYPYSLFY
ncbi:MAG: hypothetical protein WCQ60_00080 [bacterium]